MLELNDAVLEVVSGGNGNWNFSLPSLKVTKNTNYSSINIGGLFALGSEVVISVDQKIRT